MALPQDRVVASPQERAASALLALTPVVATVPMEAVVPAVAAVVAVVVAVVVTAVGVAVAAVAGAAGAAADSITHGRPGPSCRCVEPVPFSRR